MDHAAFLEAVIARPEDDAPRLAYSGMRVCGGWPRRLCSGGWRRST
jgi:hypothetical protein